MIRLALIVLAILDCAASLNALRFKGIRHRFVWISGLCSQITDTPFIESLLNANRDTRHRYFFPGHSGGLYLPAVFSNLSLASIDLPELDDIATVQNPEVIIYRLYYLFDL